MTKSRKKFDAVLRRRLRSRRCARMRRFRNWRSGTGCIRTRYAWKKQVLDNAASFVRVRGERVRGMASERDMRRPFTPRLATDGRTGFLARRPWR